MDRTRVFFRPMPQPSSKTRLYWPVVVGWLALDIVTKRWALGTLTPGMPQEVVGDWLRWSLAFNRGAAMGFHLGEWSRPVLTLVGVVMLVILWRLYRATAAEHRLQILLLGFITSGAIGNLIDRVRWTQGVVDFIDVGIGTTRFWTFNVADMGISVGAVLLAIIWGRTKDVTKPPVESGAS